MKCDSQKDEDALASLFGLFECMRNAQNLLNNIWAATMRSSANWGTLAPTLILPQTAKLRRCSNFYSRVDQLGLSKLWLATSHTQLFTNWSRKDLRRCSGLSRPNVFLPKFSSLSKKVETIPVRSSMLVGLVRPLNPCNDIVKQLDASVSGLCMDGGRPQWVSRPASDLIELYASWPGESGRLFTVSVVCRTESRETDRHMCFGSAAAGETFSPFGEMEFVFLKSLRL